MSIADQLGDLLGLEHAPVAVTFYEQPPAGIDRVERVGPSGCSYWQRASEGDRFYTEGADHLNCPVGAFTHNVDLSPDQARELEGLVTTMVQLEYLDMAEIPKIPRREAPFGVAVYSPLSRTAEVPDVVLVRGNAKQLMLLAEAARSAGVESLELMGRPTCAAIPAAMKTGRSVPSLGCIGNRVYTGLMDDEFYFTLPGSQVEKVVGRLATIVRANREMESFHRARAAANAAG